VRFEFERGRLGKGVAQSQWEGVPGRLQCQACASRKGHVVLGMAWAGRRLAQHRLQPTASRSALAAAEPHVGPSRRWTSGGVAKVYS
jgi:hypothetical protein